MLAKRERDAATHDDVRLQNVDVWSSRRIRGDCCSGADQRAELRQVCGARHFGRRAASGSV